MYMVIFSLRRQIQKPRETMTPLKERCFEIIIDNFDRYHLAYTKTENLSEKMKYEFLKRKYSFEIASELSDRALIPMAHIDFVINKYLKSLDTDWLDDCPWEITTKKFAEIGPSLLNVYFNDSEKPWEEVLCHLPNLQTVTFVDCNCACFNSISKFCPKIQSINCGSSVLCSDGFKHICYQENGVYPCPELKEIIIGSSKNVKDEDIEYLIKNLPSLEKLDYDNLPEILHSIHENDINALDKVKPYNLTYLQLINLSICSQKFNDVLKICLSVCPHLKSLKFNLLKKEHLDLCLQLPELQDLSINNCNESALELNDLLKQRGNILTSLKICNFSFSVSSLIQNCPRLTLLDMVKVSFRFSEKDTMPVLYSLKILTFRNFLFDTLTDKAMTSLVSSSPNLESLSFESCELFSPNLQTEILKCCERGTLQHVNFESSSVELKFVQDVLLTCSSLKSLNLKYCDIANDSEEMEKLESIANTLPNRPEISYHDQNSFFSDDEDLMNEYDDFLDTDEDDDDYDYDVEDDLDEYDDHDEFYGHFF